LLFINFLISFIFVFVNTYIFCKTQLTTRSRGMAEPSRKRKAPISATELKARQVNDISAQESSQEEFDHDNMSAKARKRRQKRKQDKAKRAAESASANDDEKLQVADSSESQAQASSSASEPNTMELAREWLAGLKVKDVVNDCMFDDARLEQMRDEFHSNSPFAHLAIPDMVDNQLLERVKEELYEEEFFHKSNDLYDFVQTADLKSCTKPLLSKLRDTLYSDDFREALQKITGIELNPLSDEVAVAGAMYQQTSRLLCHDDELERRRIAYILYLVPEDWDEKDGGQLDLFDVDELGEPRNVVKSLVPQWNTFSFFEVSPTSFHQVREILSKKTRMSIHGWFHGAPIDRPAPVVEAPPVFSDIKELGGDFELDKWINRLYRKNTTKKRVYQQFMEQSSIEMVNFLRRDKYEQLLDELDQLEWDVRGPAHKRHYHRVTLEDVMEQVTKQAEAHDRASDEKEQQQDHKQEQKQNNAGRGSKKKRRKNNAASSSSSASAATAAANAKFIGDGKPFPVTRQLYNMFLSQEFAKFVETMTSLELESGHVELRKFQTGDYSLSHDADVEAKQPGLDAIFTLLPAKTKWTLSAGGSTHFVDEGDEEELLSTPAGSNSLSLVYRAEPGTMRFTKYVSSKAPCARPDYFATYRCVDDDEEEEEEE
jgi:prolyl 3-hydroxylase /prolyl 3,4-dihydroxylase